ncbi:lysophospholipid acyltransferase family protein [Anditalea andensis]|uniref:Acyl-phosphate glycerol 3-phosphate acyltransferase n=1 Tax=Anditalea andensis TaxID=1048983 RepID=A0A074L0T2_9BACT|nr:lysophospholipid acyltransferase family protein [Anditalea andensis]KEO74764.1 acyl-phosphate glycerol 3-phosphate acyltransferase [Anditalea andensis]
MKILRRIYSIYGMVVFGLTFLALLPFFVLTIEIPSLKKYGRMLNRIWAKAFFIFLFMKVKYENRHHLKTSKQYIIVANHFSYMDIPTLGLIPTDAVFIGKSSLGKLPIFGYMFRNLHIAVDRNSMKSRGETILRTREALDRGSSVVIFPEGGIIATEPPLMGKFKDGAFKTAKEKKIPIIPVTLSFNHLILPDDGKLLLNFKSPKVVFHKPISLEQLEVYTPFELKDICFNIIQDQLNEDNADAVIQHSMGFQ